MLSLESPGIFSAAEKTTGIAKQASGDNPRPLVGHNRSKANSVIPEGSFDPSNLLFASLIGAK